MSKRKTPHQNGTAAKKTKTAPKMTNTASRRATRSMTTAAACRAVFDTAELMEQIMLELPMATILTSQRVCQQFRDIVVTSKKIQEKIFFRASGRPQYWTWEGDVMDGHPKRMEAKDDRVDVKMIPDRLNDFLRAKSLGTSLETIFFPEDPHAPARDLRMHLGRMVRGSTIDVAGRLEEALLSHIRIPAKQSWEQMHLTASTTISTSIYLKWEVANDESIGAYGTAKAVVKSAHGVTLGALMATLQFPTLHAVECYDKGKKYHHGEDLMATIGAYEEAYGTSASVRISAILLDGVLLPPESHRALLV